MFQQAKLSLAGRVTFDGLVQNSVGVAVPRDRLQALAEPMVWGAIPGFGIKLRNRLRCVSTAKPFDNGKKSLHRVGDRREPASPPATAEARRRAAGAKGWIPI